MPITINSTTDVNTYLTITFSYKLTILFRLRTTFLRGTTGTKLVLGVVRFYLGSLRMRIGRD